MPTIPETVYGEGGYDPAKPNNNVLTIRDVAIPVSEANRQTLTNAATNALTTNAAYLAIATPTAAQTTAQAKALTRQCSALIRLLLNQLDDTSGT